MAKSDETYTEGEWANSIIIGTPVYQGNLSALTKTMLDRCRVMVAKDPDILCNKVGATLAVGGDRIVGQEIAIQSIHHFYIISEMIPVRDGSFGANLGSAFWSQDRMAGGAAEDEEEAFHAKDHEPDDEGAGSGQRYGYPHK